MRRRAVLLPIVALAGAWLAWRQRRARLAGAPLEAPPAATELAPAAPPERFVSVPWSLVDAPPEAPELALRYACAERMELDRIDAQETPTQVFVTVLLRWRAPADGSFAWQRKREATVTLSSPLGSRALVHAPVDLGGPADADSSTPPLYP